MTLQKLISYDGVSLQESGGLYRAGVPNDSPLWGGAPWEQPLAAVSGGRPVALAPRPAQSGLAFAITVELQSITGTTVNAFLALFDPSKGARWLLIQDDTGTQWQLSCAVLRPPAPESGAQAWDVMLQAADGRWQATSEAAQSQGLSGTSATVSRSVGGNLPAPLIVEATPTAVKGQANDFIYREQVVAANRLPHALHEYPLLVGLNAQTEITATRMLPVVSGEINDLRVLVDGQETDRWLGNTGFPTALLVWWLLDLAPGRGALVTSSATAGSPANGGSLTTRDLYGFRDLPASGVALWDNEAISWSSISADSRTLQEITRAVRGTTAASHAAGTIGGANNLWWVEHQVDFIWGYSGAPVPTPNPQRKPLLDLNGSTNQLWTWSAFADASGGRPPQFTTDKQLTNAKVVAMRGAASATDTLPSGNGADANGVITGAATRWQAVDDPVATPDDDGSYVTISVVNQKFSVTAAPVAPPSGSLLQVSVTARSKGLGSNTAQGILFLRIGGTEYQGDGGGIVRSEPTSYATASDLWSTNPATGAPWAAADVASLEFGYKLTALGTATGVRVTQLYVTVTAASDADPASALGLYVAPPGAFTGHPNRDTWLVATPAGVLGSAALVAGLMTGPGGESLTGEILARNEDGDYVVVGSQTSAAAGASATLQASADTPLFEVGFRLNTAGSRLMTGFALTSLTAKLDPDHTPLVVVGPREDLYLHRWTLSNPNNGEVLTVQWPSARNVLLTIDADAGQVSYGLPGYNPRGAVVLDTPRAACLELVPGANALAWSDSQHGTGALTVNTRVRARRT